MSKLGKLRFTMNGVSIADEVFARTAKPGKALSNAALHFLTKHRGLTTVRAKAVLTVDSK